MRNCIALRKGEKEVARFYYNMSRRVANYLKLKYRNGSLDQYAPYLQQL